jgi:hypothetical protein
MNITIDNWFTEDEMYDLGLMEYAHDSDVRIIPTEFLPRVPADELQFLMLDMSTDIPSGELKDLLLRLKSMKKTLSCLSKTYIKIPFHLYKKFPKEFNRLYKDSPEYFYNFPISFKGFPNYLSKIFNLSKHFKDLAHYYQTISESLDSLIKLRSENILNSLVKPKKFNIKNLINVKNLEKKDVISLFRIYSYMKFLYFWDYFNDSNPLLITEPIKTRLYEELVAPEIAQKEKIYKKISQFQTNLTDWQLDILDNLKVYALTIKKKEKKDINLIKALFEQSKLGYFKVNFSKNLLKKFLSTDMLIWKIIRSNSITAYRQFISFLVENEQNFLDLFKKKLNPLESTKYQYISSNTAQRIKENFLFNTAIPDTSKTLKKFKNSVRSKVEYTRFKYIFDKGISKTFLSSNSEFSAPFTNSLLNNLVKSSAALSRGSFSLQPSNTKISFFDTLVESIMYKTYDRYDNYSNLLLNQFSKVFLYQLRLEKYIKELETESLISMIETEYLYKYSVLPQVKRNYYKPNDFIFCFLNKNDINNFFFPLEKRHLLYKIFNNAYQETVVEKNFGNLYRLYVNNNKNIFKNQENQKSLILMPSAENVKKDKLNKVSKNTKKKKNTAFWQRLSFIKIYLLDFNDRLPQLKITKDKKNICFYALQNGNRVDFYLPYSFDKTKLLTDWKNKKNIFGKLVEKKSIPSCELEYIDEKLVRKEIKNDFEPKVVEIDLSEFLKLTNGFSLKKQKIIPMKY